MGKIKMGSHSYLLNLCDGANGSCDQSRNQMHTYQLENLYAGAHHDNDGDHMHNTGRHGGHHDGDGDDEGENYLQNLVAGEYYYQELYAGAHHDNDGDHMHNTGAHGGHGDGDDEGENYLMNLIDFPDMPEASAARPWTQAKWNAWNILEKNGLHHQDRVFSKEYNFEPYMI